VGSVCSAKRFSFGDIRLAENKEDNSEVRKRVRQQSESFYAFGFDALLKRLDKCINVVGGYVEKHTSFSQAQLSHVMRFISIYGLFTVPLSYVFCEIMELEILELTFTYYVIYESLSYVFCVL
jgi:hypothetical protein